MKKGDGDVSFQIRPGEDMTLSLAELQKILGKKTTLPADFESYDSEIAIDLNHDLEKKYTDETIEIGEFVRGYFPGAMIYNPGDQGVGWSAGRFNLDSAAQAKTGL